MIGRLWRWFVGLLFAEERITGPDGEEYTRHWPVSEKKPRPSGRWRRVGRKHKRNEDDPR